jgi:biotin operon repressor
MPSLKSSLHYVQNLTVAQLVAIQNNNYADPMLRSVCHWALEDTPYFTQLLVIVGLIPAPQRKRPEGTTGKVLEQLKAAPDGIFITEIELSRTVDRSLHAIRRAICDLRKEGFPIHTKQKEGYRLGIGASNLTYKEYDEQGVR